VNKSDSFRYANPFKETTLLICMQLTATPLIAAYGAVLGTINIYLIYRSRKRTLLVDFSLTFVPSRNTIRENFSLNCTNDGRPITVTSFGLMLPNNRRIVYPIEPYSDDLPRLLKDGEHCKIFFETKMILNTLIKEGYHEKMELHPYFGDSLGKMYYAKKFEIPQHALENLTFNTKSNIVDSY
jgi:hypothetical protein